MVKGWPLRLMTSPTGMISLPVSSGRAEEFVADGGADDADGVGVLLIEVREEAAMFEGVEVHVDGGGPDANGLGGHYRFIGVGGGDAPDGHLRGDQVEQGGALTEGLHVGHGASRGLVGEMFLFDGHVLFFQRTLSAPPMAIMVSFIPFSMPLMIAAIPTRLATPRMMPSMVRSERNLCAHTSLRPTTMVLRRFTRT